MLAHVLIKQFLFYPPLLAGSIQFFRTTLNHNVWSDDIGSGNIVYRCINIVGWRDTTLTLVTRTRPVPSSRVENKSNQVFINSHILKNNHKFQLGFALVVQKYQVTVRSSIYRFFYYYKVFSYSFFIPNIECFPIFLRMFQVDFYMYGFMIVCHCLYSLFVDCHWVLLSTTT